MKTLARVVYRNCYVLKMVILNLNTAIVMRRRVNLHDLWQKEIHNSGWRLTNPAPQLKDLMQFCKLLQIFLWMLLYLTQCVNFHFAINIFALSKQTSKATVTICAYNLVCSYIVIEILQGSKIAVLKYHAHSSSQIRSELPCSLSGWFGSESQGRLLAREWRGHGELFI